MLQQRQIVISALIVAVIILGIASRTIHINNVIWNNYLGDALYTVMFYLIISLFWQNGSIIQKGFLAFAIMLGFELFQLTNIPLNLSQSDNKLFKTISILLGTKFEWLDILSYILGVISSMRIEKFTKP